MLQSSVAQTAAIPVGQTLLVSSVESNRSCVSPSAPASSSAASTAPPTVAADTARKEQQLLVLPPGLPPATAVAKDFGHFGATVIGSTDRTADTVQAAMMASSPANLSGAGYASVPAELCLGLSVLPSGTARLAVVSTLPWQPLFIPIGSGSTVASCSSGVASGTAAADDARCLAALPVIYQAPPVPQQLKRQAAQPAQQQQQQHLLQLKPQTSQPVQQRQQQQYQRKPNHREQRQLTCEGGLPVASAPAALQLLATPSGQLFAAPVAAPAAVAVHTAGIGGYYSGYQRSAAAAAGMQPWAIAQLGLQPTAAAAPAAAANQPAAAAVAAVQPLPLFIGGGSVASLTTSGSSPSSTTVFCQPLPAQMQLQLQPAADKPPAAGSSSGCGLQAAAAPADSEALVSGIGPEHFSLNRIDYSTLGCAEPVYASDLAVSGDVNLARQLFSGLIHILPSHTVPAQSEASPPEACVMPSLIGAVSPTVTSPDTLKVDADPQQAAGVVAAETLEGKNYEPLPSIQTLAQHCVTVAPSSSSSSAAVAASVAAALQSSSLVTSGVPLPLSAIASTDLADLLPGKYQLYAAALPGLLSGSEFQLCSSVAIACNGAAATSPAPGGVSATSRSAGGQPVSASSSTAATLGDKGCTSAGGCLSVLADGSLAVSGAEDIRELARQFKLRRLSLGLTQTQVGQALSGTAVDGPAYSQSAICRFEKLDITPKSAHKIKPVLEQWLRKAEERHLPASDSTAIAGGQLAGLPVACNASHSGTSPPTAEAVATAATADVQQQPAAAVAVPAATRKRKRRTSFTPFAVDALNEHFRKNTHPSGAEMTELANRLKYDREVVRVWFCNKRQATRNSSNRLRLSAGARSPGAVAAAPDTASSPAAIVALEAGVIPVSGVESEGDDLSACVVGSSTPFC